MKVILVGHGNMGAALLAGWMTSGELSNTEVVVVEPNECLREKPFKLGVQTVAKTDEIPAEFMPDFIVLAVKPQIIRTILPAYRKFADTAVFVSVAAGVSISLLEELLGKKAAVIRCMPNTPASIGEGMMVTCANRHMTHEGELSAKKLLSACGQVATIETESLMDAVTAVSGSGPAYVFHFIECLVAAGHQAGLPSSTARLLAAQTVYGAASLAMSIDADPGELRRQVTSPNGTTAAALDVLMGENRLMVLLTEAVLAAKKRSTELNH